MNSACSRGAGSVHQAEAQGRMHLQDGSAVANQSVQYRMIVSGTGLFAPGQNGCSRGDPHMQGILLATAQTDAGGTYRADFDLSQLKSVTTPGCTAANVDSSRISGIRIYSQLLANETTCPAFCSAQNTDASDSCVSDCESGARIIQASKSFTQGEVAALLGSSPSGVLALEQDLVFTQLGPPVSSGGGVDLAVDGDAAAHSIRITHETFAPTDCAMVEQCVGAPGLRTLLRFDGDIVNLGTQPLELGNPVDNPMFEYSACHDHYHLKDMMLYELVSPDTGEAVVVGGSHVVGRKQGFCMMDILQVNASSRSNGYDCSNQGLSPGWEDSYDSTLDCQWLDITGVPAGDYTLRITVNPEETFAEDDLSNDMAEVPVTIPADATAPAPLPSDSAPPMAR